MNIIKEFEVKIFDVLKDVFNLMVGEILENSLVRKFDDGLDCFGDLPISSILI